ncbi:RecQ family ATP-dependent DNA helicase [Lapidilactobacillus mulanensis]|uniref:RecQ family ATP-dependent DNA helicase n=1 Tax=Lapidilactobacillus mulanensis TaxID=2485999 RepID=A0ABW4DNN2_9LACO|nr:RecQ family ATP-dependent DNA helicase [Lapidilactobacillus mulanensis]
MIDQQQLKSELKANFGYDHFHAGQVELIQALLAGDNVIGVLPTGSGKSLIYQFLSLHLPGLFVIVTPLISLMEDQANRIRMSDLGGVAVLNGQLDFQEKKYVLEGLAKTKFLFLAPETLQQPEVIRQLQRLSVGLFIVDEAHCISSWGPDFRPDYLQLGAIRRQIKPLTSLVLTATATDRVVQDIQQSLFGQEPSYLYKDSVDRRNLYLRTEFVSNPEEKWEILTQLLAHPWPTLIYASTRKRAEELALLIAQKTKRRVAFYHAGLEDGARLHIQQLFLHDQLDVVVATSAFGMGIDKQNLRLLIHDEMPANFENYLQEIGRAGRDGNQALTLIFVDVHDYSRLLKRQTSHQIRPEMVEHFFSMPRIQPQADLSIEQNQVLATYRRAHFPQETVIAMLKKTSKVRDDQLQIFWDFLNSDQCLRQQICRYFDHEDAPQPHDQLCCSNSHQSTLAEVLQWLNLPAEAVEEVANSLATRQQAWQRLFD